MDAPSESFTRFGRLDRIELHHGRYASLGFPKHTHDEYVIGLNYAGLETVWLDGKTFDVPPGLITIYNPGEVQSSTCRTPGGWEFKSLYVDPATVNRLLADQTLPGSHCLIERPLIDDPELISLLQHLDPKGLSDDAPGQRDLVVDFIGRLFGRHSKAGALRQIDTTHPRLRRVIAYVNDHLAEAIPLETLAQISDLSPYHLIRACRRATGFPPHQYQLQLRIRRAKALLRAGEKIADIAAALGFVDQGHLHRNFRRLVGITPGQYRRGCA
ncbi:MAG: AraC family transcriptional regulator [Dongiaceae bacterium]